MKKIIFCIYLVDKDIWISKYSLHTMEVTHINETTYSLLNGTISSVVETTASTNNATTHRIDTHISPTTKTDFTSKLAGLEARIPPFNIAQLLHGHGHGQVVTADARANHPLNVFHNNLTNGGGGGGVDSNGNVILNMFKNSDMETGFVTAGVAICLTVIVLGVWYIVKKRRQGYFRIPTSSDVRKYDYFYKPSGGNSLDDEYENTFVGVSVPLLQEVTKV